jgi:error-prone DNA polymerase
MEDRRVIEWEKDDIEELGFMKVDVLGLGMLGCMRRAFDLLAEHKGVACLGSPVLQEDDPDVYAMIQKADTIGTFQIESRAQMSMLPRLQAEGLLRSRHPGRDRPARPIQGDMVHPYLRRREGKEEARISQARAGAVLKKTLGRAALPGAGDEGGDRRRRLHRRPRPMRFAARWRPFKSTGGVSAVPRQDGSRG